MLAVGDIAPATEMATDTDRFSLAPHDGKKMVIFFFHELTPLVAQKNPYNFLI